MWAAETLGHRLIWPYIGVFCDGPLRPRPSVEGGPADQGEGGIWERREQGEDRNTEKTGTGRRREQGEGGTRESREQGDDGNRKKGGTWERRQKGEVKREKSKGGSLERGCRAPRQGQRAAPGTGSNASLVVVGGPGGGQVWHLGHQWVLRPLRRSRRIGSPQRRQGWPARRYTQL